VDTLGRLGWAVAISPGADPADARATADRLASALKPHPTFAWGYWSLALLRLRAGDLDAAEAALRQAGPTWKDREWSLYRVVSGLCAAWRGDTESAAQHLAKAEAIAAAERPSEEKPFAHAETVWADRLIAELLLTELRAALAPRPLAPPPRERGG
jgi:hypothetical protein